MAKFMSAIALVVMAAGLTHAATNLTDGQIAKALMTINEGEIEAAKIAKGKAKNEEVKSFANAMIKDHTSNLTATKALSKKTGLKEEASTLSVSLLADAKTKNTKARMTKAADFDKAYVEDQIEMHQTALDNIDQKFLPAVTNAQLKDHLQKTRAAVATHLEHAKDLHSKLK